MRTSAKPALNEATVTAWLRPDTGRHPPGRDRVSDRYSSRSHRRYPPNPDPVAGYRSIYRT